MQKKRIVLVLIAIFLVLAGIGRTKKVIGIRQEAQKERQIAFLKAHEKELVDFIKKYIALDWMMPLEEKDLELIDKEFITDQFDTYESDLVYKVYTKEGVVYLFFLLELQSYNDFTMPFRLLVYMTAIWLDHFKNCDKNERSNRGI